MEAPLLYDADPHKHAWQYVDWQFEGDDVIFVSRTAFDDSLGGAHGAHDANYLTFHRIIDFRRSSSLDRLPSGRQQENSNSRLQPTGWERGSGKEVQTQRPIVIRPMSQW